MHWGSKLRNSARHSCRNCNKVIKIILLNLGLPFELYVHEKKLSTRFLISFQNWQRAERISLYKRSRWYIMMADSTFYNLSIDLKALLLPNRCKMTICDHVNYFFGKCVGVAGAPVVPGFQAYSIMRI